MRPGSLSPSIDPTRHVALRIVFSFAAVSFVAASLLTNWLVRAFYVISAVWVGLMTFCLFAAASCWITLGSVRVMGLHVAPNQIANGLFGAPFLSAFTGWSILPVFA